MTDKEAQAILAKQKELWKRIEKETAVTADSVNCTGDDTCKWCNPEPLTLEGDIRYLKAHIKTKDRQLAEKDAAIANAMNRGDIFREEWTKTEKELYEANIENARLREENERLQQHKRRYQEEILELEKEVMQLRTIEGDQIAEILDLEGRMEAVRVMLADAIGELKVD